MSASRPRPRRDSSLRNVHVAAAAATRLYGMSTSRPRRRLHGMSTSRRRDLSPRNVPVTVAAAPRLVSTEYPRRSRGDVSSPRNVPVTQSRRPLPASISRATRSRPCQHRFCWFWQRWNAGAVFLKRIAKAGPTGEISARPPVRARRDHPKIDAHVQRGLLNGKRVGLARGGGRELREGRDAADGGRQRKRSVDKLAERPPRRLRLRVVS